MLSGKEDGDPDDPSNYVGGVIYQYQVEFDMPPAGDDGVYVPTRQYEAGIPPWIPTSTGTAGLKSCGWAL